MWTVVHEIHNAITVPHNQSSSFNWTHLCCHWRCLGNSTRVILQTGSQIQRTSSGLHYVNCGPGHKQCSYSSAYSGFNIQLNESAMILEICRQFNAINTANIVPNTAHILQITLCEQWSRPYTMYLELRIFRIQYSTEGSCAAIGDISRVQCALHCKLSAKYSAHPPVYAMWTVVPDIYNVFTAPNIQASIFNWTYLRWYWWYLDISMSVILQS
jgi:hypothetical protein